MDIKNIALNDIKTGLEMELLRVNAGGRLAKTPHPFPGDKNLDRDFCENQLEIITPPCDGIDAMLDCLRSLQQKAVNGLKNEYLWFCSNPPHFDNEDCIFIANFTGNQSFKSDYRQNLEQRYGKRLMLYSGVHFNISFGDDMLKGFGVCDRAQKNAFYIKLAKYCSMYSWVIVLLTAASPVYELSLESDHTRGSGFDGYASRRQSKKGYWNNFIPTLDYTSFDTYASSINDYVTKGVLFSPGELYTPVRIKPTLDESEKGNISHIELRMLDINPLSQDGINADDLHFIHYFMVYLASMPDFDFTAELQKKAIINHQNAARFDLGSIEIDGKAIMNAAEDFLYNMRAFYKDVPDAEKAVDVQLKKITKGGRYCIEIRNNFGNSFNKKMFELSKEYSMMKRESLY